MSKAEAIVHPARIQTILREAGIDGVPEDADQLRDEALVRQLLADAPAEQGRAARQALIDEAKQMSARPELDARKAEAPKATSHKTREDWLNAAVAELRPLVAEAGAEVPPKVRVACSFPSTRATSAKQARIGEAWAPSASADKTHETFISPVLDDAVEVLAVLAHELVHHAVGVKHGHKGPFRKVATALGLEGKMTATVPGEALAEQLKALADRLGPYPHAKLDATKSGRKKQGTRLLKVECPACGYIARVTSKWIEDVGAPLCPCSGESMEVAQ